MTTCEVVVTHNFPSHNFLKTLLPNLFWGGNSANFLNSQLAELEKTSKKTPESGLKKKNQKVQKTQK